VGDCGGRPPAEGRGLRARREYRCLACGEAFALEDQFADAEVVCPACGSGRVREHWESRVRNAGTTPPGRLAELRDRPG
jgi:putative FmdB family regulatory protein